MTAMFMMQTTSVIRSSYPAGQRGAAVQLYERALGTGRRRRVWSRLRGQPSQLFALSKLPSPSHDGGVHTVAICQIHGSENGCLDFDADFHPLHLRTRERWLSIASARLGGAELPPIELIQVGNSYFVQDGHHRLSVARALGEEFIEAHVIGPN